MSFGYPSAACWIWVFRSVHFSWQSQLNEKNQAFFSFNWDFKKWESGFRLRSISALPA